MTGTIFHGKSVISPSWLIAIKRKTMDELYNEAIHKFKTNAKLTSAELECLVSTKSLREVLDMVAATGESRKHSHKNPITKFLGWFVGETLEKLDRFSGAIDVLTSSNPAISGLVWGGLKVVLVVISLTSQLKCERSIEILRTPLNVCW
jgi:Asp-tRNA(Asn)/Glu-tRNA(Gln) amidotransferase B subunit